jgi:two-component system, cell cycle response regulator DivK
MDSDITVNHGNCILVVDDSEDMRSLLGQILESAGYLVIFAEDGVSALTEAVLHRPNLILMDLSLPGMSGWEAVERLRQINDFRDTPIIAVSAHVTPYEQARALAIGCTAHIGKPFNSGDLLTCVRHLLNNS